MPHAATLLAHAKAEVQDRLGLGFGELVELAGLHDSSLFLASRGRLGLRFVLLKLQPFWLQFYWTASVERCRLKTSNSTRVYAGTNVIHLQSQVHSARELRRQNSRATLTSRWRRFLPFACWPPVCWSSPISSQAARTPHRMDRPRNTRNTRNPETGLFAFRVFRVFRGYHLGCGFAALARLVLATPDEDFGPSGFGFWWHPRSGLPA